MNISIESKYKKALLKHLDIERELQSLPHGYISKKVIHGKTQYYLQRRVGKRIIGKYRIHRAVLNLFRDRLRLGRKTA